MCDRHEFCNRPNAYTTESNERMCIVHAIEHATSMGYGLMARVRTGDDFLMESATRYIAIADRLRAEFMAGKHDDVLANERISA